MLITKTVNNILVRIVFIFSYRRLNPDKQKKKREQLLKVIREISVYFFISEALSVIKCITL